METIHTVLEQLTDDALCALETVMAEHFPDFAQIQRQYHDAVDALRTSIGEGAAVSAEDEVQAIRQQAASDLLFAGLLGLKANWDRFADPIARNFMDVDSEIYLREETAHRLPAYVSARQTRDRFYAQLSPEQQRCYEDVNAYASYMETVGPKLAHYYGYILGNRLLPLVVPGYHPDRLQTQRYTAMLEAYFGEDISGILSAFL